MQSFCGKNFNFKTFKIFIFHWRSGLKGGVRTPRPSPWIRHCICFKFWLVHCIVCVSCDWSEWWTLVSRNWFQNHSKRNTKCANNCSCFVINSSVRVSFRWHGFANDPRCNESKIFINRRQRTSSRECKYNSLFLGSWTFKKGLCHGFLAFLWTAKI